MIPIGGYYTIDTKEALEYINQIQPRIVIPMHYRSGSMGYDVLSTNEEFIKIERYLLCKRCYWSQSRNAKTNGYIWKTKELIFLGFCYDKQ